MEDITWETGLLRDEIRAARVAELFSTQSFCEWEIWRQKWLLRLGGMFDVSPIECWSDGIRYGDSSDALDRRILFNGPIPISRMCDMLKVNLYCIPQVMNVLDSMKPFSSSRLCQFEQEIVWSEYVSTTSTCQVI